MRVRERIPSSDIIGGDIRRRGSRCASAKPFSGRDMILAIGLKPTRGPTRTTWDGMNGRRKKDPQTYQSYLSFGISFSSSPLLPPARRPWHKHASGTDDRSRTPTCKWGVWGKRQEGTAAPDSHEGGNKTAGIGATAEAQGEAQGCPATDEKTRRDRFPWLTILHLLALPLSSLLFPRSPPMLLVP